MSRFKEKGDKGLGDTIARFTKKTGIEKVVKTVSKITGIPCGCDEKQQTLNNKFPYK